MMPDCLTHAPLYAVAHDRFADCARNCKTKSCRNLVLSGPKTEGGEIAAGHAHTGLIDLPKLTRP